MDYPYKGRNLFSEPETYFYAACTHNAYLDAWLTYRHEIMCSLEQSITQNDTVGTPLELSETGQLFQETLTTKDVDLLGRIVSIYVVKYEVGKRLFSTYGPNHTRIPDVALAQPQDYVKFAECLTALCYETKNLKYLSTLMKVCDALCSVKIDNRLNKNLFDILKAEKELVLKNVD